jgi:hypothetical protein
MGDAFMTPGSNLEAGLSRLENIQESGLLDADAATKAQGALVAFQTPDCCTRGTNEWMLRRCYSESARVVRTRLGGGGGEFSMRSP